MSRRSATFGQWRIGAVSLTGVSLLWCARFDSTPSVAEPDATHDDAAHGEPDAAESTPSPLGDAATDTADAAPTSDAAVERRLRLFVSSPTIRVSSLDQADDLCRYDARGAELEGKFVAYLAHSSRRAEAKLIGARWYDLADNLVFDLNPGRAFAAPKRAIPYLDGTERDSMESLDDLVWTGTNQDGSSHNSCWHWEQDNADFHAKTGCPWVGAEHADPWWWWRDCNHVLRCDWTARLYCFETAEHCTSDDECPLDASHCTQGACVQCTSDNDCASNERCQAQQCEPR